MLTIARATCQHRGGTLTRHGSVEGRDQVREFRKQIGDWRIKTSIAVVKSDKSLAHPEQLESRSRNALKADKIRYTALGSQNFICQKCISGSSPSGSTCKFTALSFVTYS